jgi:predicted dehydrogenase
MDLSKSSLYYRVKKALRYVRLYGVRRTLVKVRSHYHEARTYGDLPPLPSRLGRRAHVGIIGCGKYAYGVIAYYLRNNYGRVLHAAMDCNIHRAASLFEAYGLNYYTDDADKLISDPAIDLVYIASNHASHAEYAIRALQRGKSVHIEKPHVVNEDQLGRLCAAMAASPGKVALGFNRPQSRMGQAIKAALDSQEGPAVLNWFVVGHPLPADHWYHNPGEGGQVLGNVCHWADFLYTLVPPEKRFPIRITPTRARRPDCDMAVTYLFGDGTVAALTFSAKGDTFEGVRERFSAQRGNVLIAMDDFQRLTIEEGVKKRRISPWFRDHGHERRVCASYGMVSPGSSPGCSIAYVWESAQLFLKTKQSLEENRPVIVEPFQPEQPAAQLVCDNAPS